MFILLFIFLLAIIAIQMFLSQNALSDPNNQCDILYYFAQQLSGTPIAYLMVLAVLSSTVATTQTTLLPSSRLTFSMARDGVFPKAVRPRPQQLADAMGRDDHLVRVRGDRLVSVTVDSFNTVFGTSSSTSAFSSPCTTE